MNLFECQSCYAFQKQWWRVLPECWWCGGFYLIELEDEE